MGGKGKIGKHISKRIFEIEDQMPFQTDSYFEPFIGMCGVMRNMGERKKIACDLSEDIVNMWRDLQKGWKPPSSMTKDEFNFQKTQPSSALKCFAAHGCSYGGIYFSTYIGNYNKGNEEIDRSSRSIIRVSSQIQDVEFLDNKSYKEHNPKNSTIYCDPPYSTATKAVLKMPNFVSFNHEDFWNVMRQWVVDGNIVIVSEFTCPNDFKPVWERKIVSNVNHKGHRLEKLFMHESQSIYIKDTQPGQ